MTAMVIEAFDESLYVNILDHIFALKEVPFREVKVFKSNYIILSHFIIIP